MKLNPFRTVLSLVLAGGSLAAQADTVNLSDFTFAPATSVSVGTPNYSGAAGQMSGLLNGNSFVTYCTDLLQSFSFNTLYTDYSVVNGVTAWGATKAGDLNKLISAAIAAAEPSTAARSAAIQAAVWEVLYETSGTYNFAAGTFLATSGDAATQTALNQLNWANVASATVTHTVDQLYSREHQDFLVTQAVPEPGTYAMMAAGLAMVGFIGRRRTRKA
jgi:hypothetical protein